MRLGITRRRFLASASGTAAVTVLPLSAWGVRAPLERHGPAKKVVIVGAGLAGLSAGFELTQAGHDVTILEAQTRVGGRACSIRHPFSDNLYAEAGATSIAETNDLVLKYVDLFDLQLDSWDPPSGLQDILYIRGRRIRRTRGVEPADLPFDLTAEERKLGRAGLIKKYAVPVYSEMRDIAEQKWPTESLW